MTTTTTTRPICEIAKEIEQLWPKPYFGAAPYLGAMLELQTINDDYGVDNAKSIVNYFLANAFSWHGADARRIKQELKNLVQHGI